LNNSFGRRQNGLVHASLVFGNRQRRYCTVQRRTRDVVYLELAEDGEVPFRFALEYETGSTAFLCEVKMQRGKTLIAFIAHDYTAQKTDDGGTNGARRPSLETVEKWTGDKRESSF